MTNKSNINYPKLRKDETIADKFFSQTVPDPYRYLEDPESNETKQFIADQNAISREFLENPANRSQIMNKLHSFWNYPKYGLPSRQGDKYYFSMNNGLQNQSVIYQQDTLDAEPRVFLDPNILSDDGTVSLQRGQFSRDGNFYAYGLSEKGSDWLLILIKDLRTHEDLPEAIEYVKFSGISWTHDNKGFFYSKFTDQTGQAVGSETEKLKNHKIFYHTIFTEAEEDKLVVMFPDPTWLLQGRISHCGNYLIIDASAGSTENVMYYADLRDSSSTNYENIAVYPIIDKMDASYSYVTNIDDEFLVFTNKDAPRFRIVKINLESVDESDWVDFIKEDDQRILTDACCAKDKLVLHYLDVVISNLEIRSLVSGKLLRIISYDKGSVAALHCDSRYSELFYYFTSYVNAGIIYKFDVADAERENVEPVVFRDINKSLKNIDPSKYEYEIKTYKSKDKTEITLHLVQRKQNTRDPLRPCLLYGYGGFGISMLPRFSLFAIMFIETFDGIYAVANIRGGGEKGEKWHDSGRRLNKQNSFDDFMWAAKYLICNQYTSRKTLCIMGGSNGGLLVGACITQRPKLYRSAIISVGVLDMLRFSKFTIGQAWVPEYGDTSDRNDFETLYKYSPLHNIRELERKGDRYPATLILTGEQDDRVSPLHSFKFAATIQEIAGRSKFQTYPLLLRVYEKVGHGAGKPTTKQIEEYTDILVFLSKTLKLKLNWQVQF